MNSESPNEWHTIVEYARRHKISDMTVRRHIKSGKLHAVLRDGKYFIPSQTNQRKPDNFQKAFQGAARAEAATSQTMLHSSSLASMGKDKAKPSSPSLKKMKHIPEEICDLFSRSTVLNVPVQKLLDLCDELIASKNQAERRLQETYENKILHLQAQTQAKELEIKQLYQQVEDLQVLIRILENGDR